MPVGNSLFAWKNSNWTEPRTKNILNLSTVKNTCFWEGQLMKSAVFYGKHDLRVEEHEMPKVGPKDVLIQVKACGVCGTDVHIYEGDKGQQR